MTEGMNLSGPMTATHEEVADIVVRAIRRKRDVVYVKQRWSLVMAIIRLPSEKLFKKSEVIIDFCTPSDLND